MVKRRKRSRRVVRRSGMLPGEARRRSLVTVLADTFAGESDELGRDTRNYIVATRRLDGVWTHTIEYRGATWELPGKVIDQINRHRQSILDEQRRIRAVERVERMLQA